MRLSSISLGLVCMCAVVSAVPLQPQEQDDVRGAFLTSRPKEKPPSNSTTPRPSRRRPKPVASNDVRKTSDDPAAKPASSSTSKPGLATSTGDKTKPTAVNVRRIGLGLTLFMRDSNGLAVRTDPAHVFRKGDRVRVLLETNSDGYLYIFNTTNNGPPVMIYPDVDLDEAGNYLRAHVPFEIPSSLATEERLRWLAFDEFAGDERLYFVFSREPLDGLPIEDDLVRLCRESKSNCPVRPTADVWEQVQTQMKQPLQTDRTERYGRAETSAEQHATTRGLGLAKDDPQPSLIMMASSTSSILVATLDLIHK